MSSPVSYSGRSFGWPPAAWRRCMPVLILSLAFVHNLLLSWRKWGDVVIDCGRELDIARQLAEGRILYSEVRYFYGPLTPWINGGLMKVFGIHADTLIAAGIAVAALCCWAIYTLARCYTGRIGATLAAVSFLYMSAFAHLTPNGIFNFALPYTSAATYGITCALLCVLGLVRFSQTGRRGALALSLIFFALTGLTKIELLLAVGLPHVIFLALRLWEQKRAEVRLWSAYALAFAAIAAAYLFAARDSGFGVVWRENLFPLVTSQSDYSKFHMGLINPAESLLNMLKSMGVATVLIAGVVALARITPAAGSTRNLLYAVAGAGGFAVYFWMPLDLAFLLATPVSVIVILAGLKHCILRRDPRGIFRAQILLWSFALGCMARMLLKPITYHYGFYLFPPMALALTVGWLVVLPYLISELKSKRATVYCAGLGVVLAWTWTHYSMSSTLYSMHTVEMRAPRGHMWLLNVPNALPQGQFYAGTVNVLAAMPKGTRVLVLPQGVGLAFFSGQNNPYGIFGYNAPEMSGSYSDDAMFSLLERNPPDLVLRTPTDALEYGNQYFGKDYGQKTWGWIQANTKPVIGVGPAGFLTIYAREGVDVSALLKAAGNPPAPSADPASKK